MEAGNEGRKRRPETKAGNEGRNWRGPSLLDDLVLLLEQSGGIAAPLHLPPKGVALLGQREYLVGSGSSGAPMSGESES